MFDRFASWDEVLSFVARSGWLWYHAPLDVRPVSVRVVRVYKSGKIRIDPGVGADAFTIDAGHLDRLRRQRKGA